MDRALHLPTLEEVTGRQFELSDPDHAAVHLKEQSSIDFAHSIFRALGLT